MWLSLKKKRHCCSKLAVINQTFQSWSHYSHVFEELIISVSPHHSERGKIYLRLKKEVLKRRSVLHWFTPAITKTCIIKSPVFTALGNDACGSCSFYNCFHLKDHQIKQNMKNPSGKENWFCIHFFVWTQNLTTAPWIKLDYFNPRSVEMTPETVTDDHCCLLWT